VEKSAGEMDVLNQTVTYTVRATAPATNILNAKNVVVTDTFDDSSKNYIEQNGGKYYRNAEASKGTFDMSTGIWTIGEMEPGEVATLTYQVKLKQSYFSSGAAPLSNKATATFNESGKVEDSCAVTPGTGTVILSKVKGTNINGSTQTGAQLDTDPSLPNDERNFYYYTVQVKAYNGDMKNVSVEDHFTENAGAILRYEVVSAQIGDMSVLGTNKGPVISATGANGTPNMTWNIGDLAQDTSATVTYKVYLKASAWDNAAKYDSNGSRLTIRNRATVYVADTPYDYKEQTQTVTKYWIKKTGTKVSEGRLQFVVYANGFPISSTVTSLSDTMDGGTFEDATMTIDLLDSTSATTPAHTYTIPLSKILTDSTKTSWKITDMTKVPQEDGSTVDISGPWYYRITYYVNAPYAVTNGAGIGIAGKDNVYTFNVTLTGSDFAATKEVTDVSYGREYATWKTTVTSGTIAKGMVYKDWCTTIKGSTEYMAGLGEQYFFVTDDDLAKIVIKQGDTVIDPSKYDVEPVIKDNAPEGQYYGFNIIFKDNITGIDSSAAHRVTIEYPTSFDLAMIDSNLSGNDVTFENNGEFDVSEDGPAVFEGLYAYSMMRPSNDMGKGFTRYNEETGELVWNINCNYQGVIYGTECYIDEIIPDDQEYVSASVKGYCYYDNHYWAGDINGRNAQFTKFIHIKDTEIVKEADHTKVRITIGGLIGEVWRNVINMNDAENVKTTTISTDGNVGVHGTSWNNIGRFQVTVTTRMKDEYQQQGVKNHVFHNTATLIADGIPGGSATASASSVNINATPPMSKSVKEEDGYSGGNYVLYTLVINSGGADLVSAEGEKVTVTDELIPTATDGAHMATELGSNWFTATDSMGADITDQCELIYDDTGLDGDDETHTSFKLKVPDETPVTVKYYVAFNGVVGDNVSLKNKAYFDYNYVPGNNTEKQITTNIVVSDADFSSASGKHFYLLKQDQWGNPVNGATFNLYVLPNDPTQALNADGTVDTSKCEIATTTGTSNSATYENIATGTDGSGDGKILFRNLDADRIYCYEETDKPDGYSGTVQGVIEFQRLCDSIADIKPITSSTIITGTNTFNGAEYAMPLTKTVKTSSGKDVDCTVPFSFTMTNTTKAADNTIVPVYTDEECSNELAAGGMTATIEGCGTTTFNTLHFKTAGTYTFNIAEDNLNPEEINNGYSKDETVYTATMIVDKHEDNSLYVKEVTIADQNGNPYEELVFNNTFGKNMTGSWTPGGVKVLNGERCYGIRQGEFEFEVLEEIKENGEWKSVVKSTGKTAAGNADNNYVANIIFDAIPYTVEDLGRHGYTIKEKVLSDANINYAASDVYVIVDVEAVNGELVASKVDYYSDLDLVNGVPQFVNEYFLTPETGIHLDFLHYVLVLILAGSALVLSQFRKKKHRGEAD
jgi:hypothetical protein